MIDRALPAIGATVAGGAAAGGGAGRGAEVAHEGAALGGGAAGLVTGGGVAGADAAAGGGAEVAHGGAALGGGAAGLVAAGSGAAGGGGTVTGGLTHFDAQGRAVMVDVSGKPETARVAVARARVSMAAATLRLVRDGTAAKGDVLGVARLAGIMAAKRTAELIPLCHPLPISAVELALESVEDGGGCGVEIAATVRTTGRTGVEMEALTAASVAALTVYDMLKAVDRGMRVDGLRVVHKDGGKSGVFRQD